MKFSFTKITSQTQDIELCKDDIKFSAQLFKLNKNSVKCQGNIKGNLSYICDRCGNEFMLKIDENIEVIAHNGVAELSSEELENVIEFFDGDIDCDEIFTSELEAIKSDYYYCDECKNLKGE